MENKNSYIQIIKEFPEKLELVVKDLSDSQLDRTYGEGKWTIRQVVHHLADSHNNGFSRMKMILTENNPTLKTYDQEKWAELHDSKLSINCSLQILRGLHERMADLLSSLNDDDWAKRANHPEDGPLDMSRMLKEYANHGEKHIGHIMLVLNK